MKDVRVFNLKEALSGKPVWHIGQDCWAENVTLVGDRVAFILSKFPMQVFHCDMDGKSNTGLTTLAMEIPTKTLYVNIWDSPSFHYTRYKTLEEAQQDTRGLSHESKSSLRHKKLNPEPIKITIEE